MRLLAALALSIVVVAPASAQTAAAEQTAPAKPAKPAKEKKICRTNELAMGSRVSTGRTCKTAAQWAVEDGKSNPSGDDGERKDSR